MLCISKASKVLSRSLVSNLLYVCDVGGRFDQIFIRGQANGFVDGQWAGHIARRTPAIDGVEMFSDNIRE